MIWMCSMLGICTLMTLVKIIRAEMEGFIVGGTLAKIKEHPHAASLFVACYADDGKKESYMCGASILNQQILLTSASALQHGPNLCTKESYMRASMGSEHTSEGIVRSGIAFVVHEKYNSRTQDCDIGLVKMRTPVKFTATVRRVVIMKSPPLNEPVTLSGWGATTFQNHSPSNALHELEIKVLTKNQCEKLFTVLPRGTICGMNKDPKKYAAWGDDSAPLMVRGFIQIGVLSYVAPKIGFNVNVYTFVGYHYDWIKSSALRLLCS